MIKPLYEFNWKKNKCEIILGDLTVEEIDAMLDYCDDFNLELNSFSVSDVSDVSGQFDTIATFKFDNEEDTLAFKLKFKCK